MSNIDKKYRQEFEHRQFSDSLKKAGWARMEGKLDEAFPVAPGGSGSFWGTKKLMLLVVALAGLAVIFWPDTVNVESENTIAPPGQTVPEKTITGDETGNHPLEKIRPEERTKELPAALHKTIISSETGPGKTGKSPGGVVEEGAAGNKIEDNTVETAPVSRNNPLKSMGHNTGHENVRSTEENYLEEKQASYASIDELISEEETPEADPGKSTFPEEKLSPDEALATMSENLRIPQKSEVGQEPAAGENTAKPERVPEATEPVKEDGGILEDHKDEKTEEEIFANNKADASEKGREEALKEETHRLRLNHLAFDIPNEKFNELPGKLKAFALQRFSLAVSGGVAYTAKELRGGPADYLEKRRREESIITTYPIGIDLDYYLNKHWTFGTGIWWSQYGEELQYNAETIDSVSIDGRYTSPYSFGEVVRLDSTRIIDSINVGHWNYDVAYKAIDTTIQGNNGFTSWRYTEIPFMVGYRFGKGRIKPWLRAGILVGFPTGGNFRYVDPQTGDLSAPGRFGELVAPLQFSYMGRAGFDFYLTRRFSIRLDALGTYQINSSLRNSTVSQRYYRLGGTLSLAYYF